MIGFTIAGFTSICRLSMSRTSLNRIAVFRSSIPLCFNTLQFNPSIHLVGVLHISI